MRKLNLAWGVVIGAVLGVGTAQAAPKTSGAPAVNGAGGAPAVAPSSSVPAPPPSNPARAAGSAAPEAVVPSAPADATPPAAPDAAPPPAAAKPDLEGQDEQDEEDEEREARRKARKRRHQKAQYAEELETEDASPVPVVARAPETWRLAGPHFMLSAERVTNALSWSETTTLPSGNGNGNGTSTSIELKRSGTDVSFLGSGTSYNLFGVPRIGFDGMFANGVTLGGSLSYLVTSGEHESPLGTTQKVTQEDPTTSIFVFAPRVGVMLPATPKVGVWLRGGISRISRSIESKDIDPQTGAQLTTTSTTTLVNVTLDPQLVISPVPHVGLTVGALLDIGVSGSAEYSYSGTNSAVTSMSNDTTASSYGVTGGLVAIF